MSKIMLTRTITTKLTFITNRNTDWHGTKSGLQILTSISIDMIPLLHHDLKFFINFVELCLCSWSQIYVKLSI